MPSATKLDCPECGSTLRLKTSLAELAGKSVRCPQCDAKFRVPDETAESDEEELPELPAAPKASRASAPPPLPARKKKSRDVEDTFSSVGSRRGKGETRPVATAFLLWTAFGFVGACLGFGLWTAITYFTHRGLGILAIVVGGLIGGGVRLGAREHEGWMPGLTSVVLALGTIFASNVAVTYLLFDDDGSGFAGGPGFSAEEQIIAEIATNEVVPEFAKQGLPHQLPEAELVNLDENSTTKDLYPPAVWAEAEKRWKSLPPDQQAAKRQQFEQVEQLAQPIGTPLMFFAALLLNFGITGVVCSIIAGVMAYRMGSTSSIVG